jgi:hypothetical protein
VTFLEFWLVFVIMLGIVAGLAALADLAGWLFPEWLEDEEAE